MRRILASLALLALSALGGGISALTLEGRLVDAGKHKLWISCAGTGGPTVVIDVGIGGDPREWTRVVDDLRRDVRVCQYERAGYGASEPGPLPRDARREGEELLALLRNAGEKPPYLLAGHSLGALNAYVLAGSHGSLLAGLALLDPPPLRWLSGEGWPGLREMAKARTEQFREVAAKLAASPNAGDKNRAPRFVAMASEHEMLFSESARQAAAVKSLGNLPLLVVGTAKPNPILGADAVPYQSYTVEENRKLSARSSDGKFVLLEESGHMMHHDAPERTAAVLRDLLSRARAKSRPE
jgi:pimeloyl-ACP methyl ester carboxylesterase